MSPGEVASSRDKNSTLKEREREAGKASEREGWRASG